MKKIDSKGNYLEFNGITVISFPHFNKIFGQIYHILNRDPDIKKYYSPLPLDSYHMTVKNHLVGYREDIEEEMKKDVYIEMDRLCKDFQTSIPVKAVGINFGNTIQIRLKIENKASEKIETLRESIVKLGSKREDGFIFHITLAYRYKTFDQTTNFKVGETIGNLLKNEVLIFEPPVLCVFKDMTKFTPLITEKTYKTCIYIKYKNIQYTLLEFENVYISPIERHMAYIGVVQNGKLIPNSDTVEGLTINAIYGPNCKIEQKIIYIKDSSDSTDEALFAEIWSGDICD